MMAGPLRRGHPDQRAVIELTRALGHLLAELGLAELEVEVGGTRIRLQRSAPALPAAPPMSGPSPMLSATSAADAALASPGTTLVTVESPMVGTFYRAPSPTADPYVVEGDIVKEGQILCLIEAMKLMNEVESKVAGRVVKILVENGQPVEFAQPLFLVEPRR
jgi:acetyl-CoA carboxylase biotin carboxyl carrier protein